MKNSLTQQFLKVLDTLNESQRRWYVAREAKRIGRGGVTLMGKLTGMSRTTITMGMKELENSETLGYQNRVRKTGGGRKRLEKKDPLLLSLLDKIMEDSTAGDPMGPLKWTNKSTTQIAQELMKYGHTISDESVRRKLHERDYTLQANKKNKEGRSPPERDAQFIYINKLAKRFLKNTEPLISVDTKKKELVGNFKNNGSVWRRKGNPEEVNVHDFPDLGKGKAVPYGAYDVTLNKGFVNVGISSDTSEFAVESIRQWWKQLGRRHHPKAKELLICADCGGSNGSRNRGWKFFLHEFAKESKLRITVCHYPPGTSKWNKIEHRLFSFISMNWKGKPLIDYQVVINFIKNTRTKSGLKVYARLDQKKYEKGLKFSDDQINKIQIKKHHTNPQWNYTISDR